MTDQELLQAASAARGAAHRAPSAEVYAENINGMPTGKLRIRDHTNGWADRATDLHNLWLELKRRGLSLPPCDCPPDAHR